MYSLNAGGTEPSAVRANEPLFNGPHPETGEERTVAEAVHPDGAQSPYVQR
jgi:hypothetical protein